MMLKASEIEPHRWEEVGAFALCESQAEVFVAIHTLHGLAGVDRLLTEAKGSISKQSLRGAADELARVGLKPAAALIRRHARKAPQAKPSFRERWAER